MKNYLFLFLFTWTFAYGAVAKAKEKSGTIKYKVVVNGEERSRYGYTELHYHQNVVKIQKVRSGNAQQIPTTPDEATYIDLTQEKIFDLAILNTGNRFHTASAIADLPEVEITEETQEILGYTCKKATLLLFSNRIDLWFTTETGLRGTPYPQGGLTEGVVLKMVRNGSYELVADAIEFIKPKKMPALLPENLGEEVDKVQYRARIVDNYVTTVNVFDREQISWGNEINNPEGDVSGETYHFAGGTVILKKVKLPEVTDDYSVFAKIVQYSNGDAYDRTGSVFMIPTDKKLSFLEGLKNGAKSLPKYLDTQGKEYQGVIVTDEYTPALELVRFFTPFGIRHFNEKRKVAEVNWEDSTVYKQDISYLLPELQGEAWIGAFIGNYDKGGHILSLDLKYYPGSSVVREQTKKYWVQPIFNTLNLMEMAGQEYGTMFDGDSLKVTFNVPEGVKNVRLQYISTGHGGWGGGDEFNQKSNELFIDGQKVFTHIPWRSDCAAFRKYNPASGNFWNGISSSDLSRSGWCPGSATNPVTIPLFDMEAGTHQLQVAIPLGQREGSSFSAWNISGVLVGEYE
ncbi:PNGase F N-terminal domain-containing protein [Rapidithrix thailandica]|uniref:PNGase F N-terminal domain-containing protein n=1 Tax=Rapidithrix thailandica TaxID=413964 RepID=A0AAW9SCC2_9BACT